MKAKKSYGQHFLINESIAAKIGSSLLIDSANHKVLEIGPGKGVLTKYLLTKNYRLKVVEADMDMVNYLKKHYTDLHEDIIFLDFLKLSLEKVFDGEPFSIIGNYPYNISSQILIKMVNHHEFVPEMVGMFQKEVADRVVAPPGSKTYGVISVLVQAFYEGEMLFYVGPENFNPPPKVNSAVIRLTRKKDTNLGCNERLFRHMVKTAFNQRRKMLRNTLKPLVEDNNILSQPFFEQRPEQLSVDDFVYIVKTLEPFLKIK
ncbi:MAG: 16S rRNA (adenine(1518)-N(6)/adenine(1519)-N(6))-dimethyltransferase RsmA [Saprospiraceae bacterium]